MKIILGVAVVGIWAASPPPAQASPGPVTCGQLESAGVSVSGVILGCASSGVKNGVGDDPWDVSAIFQRLPEDEKLLARLNFIVPLQNYPSQKEVSQHLAPKFNAGARSLSVADLLIINTFWPYDISLFFELLKLLPESDKMDPLHRHIYEATLLEIASHYQQDYMNDGTYFVDTQTTTGALQDSRVPWSKTILAAQHLEYGLGIQDPQIALDLYKSECCATPNMAVIAGRLAEDDRFLLQKMEKEALVSVSNWVKGGSILALSWFDSIQSAAPQFAEAPSVITTIGYLKPHVTAFPFLRLTSAGTTSGCRSVWPRR